MERPDRKLYELDTSLPEECRKRLGEARAAWVKKHAERDVEAWKQEHPGPGYWDNPIAIDRYEEYCERLGERAEARWAETFDKEVLPRALERFMEELGSE